MGRAAKPTRSSSTHVETGPLDRRRDRAIPRAARNVIGGKLGGHFPSVVWQTGSGSQIDINLDTGIANPANVALAGELGFKKAVHQNDRVDIGRSSNDSFPTAMHIAAVLHIVHDPALNDLHRALRAKEQPFAKIVKIVRTYTRNATPLTLGLEYSDDAPQFDNGTKRLELAVTELIPPKNEVELLDHVDGCVWYDTFNSTARRIRALVRRASYERHTPRADGTLAH